MRKSRLLVENFFSPASFPLHSVAAESSIAGNEPFRVGTARRSPLNFWTSAADNTATWVKVDCQEARAADMLAIDRGHNLGGVTVQLQRSNDDFAADVTTVRSFAVPGAPSDEETAIENVARTEEGAVILSFTSATSRYWRLLVPAMGAGARPRVVGLYLGESWKPEFHFGWPWSFGDRDLEYGQEVSDSGWSSATRTAQRLSVTLQIRLERPEEYAVARRHVEERVLRRHATWLVMDQDFAERAWLAESPPGRGGFQRRPGWGYFQAEVALVEKEPAIR